MKALSYQSRAVGTEKGPAWTLPVVANGLLYLRFKQQLVCYDLMPETQ